MTAIVTPSANASKRHRRPPNWSNGRMGERP
jgi:hypothetical protein